MAEYAALAGGGGSNSATLGGGGNNSRSNLRRFSKPVARDLSAPLNATTDGICGDPFNVFRDDLRKKLELVDEALAEFLRVVDNTDTCVSIHERKEAKKQLKRHIKNAELVLGDLRATVQLVEKYRDKFNRINSAELYERKALVNTSQERLDIARLELTSEHVNEKLLTDEREKSLRRATGMMGPETEVEHQNTGFMVDSHASLLMRQQDEALETLDFAVTRVGYIAEKISEEIGAQNKMLDEMDEDLATAEDQLGIVMGKLAKLLKTKNKCQLGTILCLTAAVIVLFLLVLYT